MSLPDFSSGCKPCDSSQQADTKFFPSVPTCPGFEYSKGVGCVSNAGKFFDRLTENILLPLVGQEVKGYVCQPELWSACQWAAFCYASGKIAILKIVDISIPDKYIKLVNACQDGTEISDNPAPGTELPKNTVLYPVPPPWCGQELCDKLNSALADGDCACQGVLDCLEASEDICFASVPEPVEGEEVHLFGGTMTDDEGNEEPSFWKSCLRKIRQIFTGYSAKTLCFSDMPETTNAPDIINGVPVKKRSVVLDGFNCLRKGPVVTAGSCDIELNILSTEDEHHTGTANVTAPNENTNAKGRVFDSLKVCREGVERVLIPSASCKAIVSFKDEDDVFHWEETSLGGRVFMLDTPMVLSAGDNIALTDYAKYNRAAGDCKLHAIVSAFYRNSGASSAANSTWSLTVNGWLGGSAPVIGSDANDSYQPNIIVTLTENKITCAFTQSGSGGALSGAVLRLRGYIIGASQL